MESDAFWALQRTQYLCQIDGTCFELSTFENLKLSGTGCPAAWSLKKIGKRKLRIQKIGKIGNFVLKNRRKIGKSIVLSLT